MFIIEITNPHGRRYPCPKCTQIFKTIRALGGHKRWHTMSERKEALDQAKESQNPGADTRKNPNSQRGARRVRLGKSPISEAESEADWSGTDTGYEFESESKSECGSGSRSESDVKKPRLDNHGRSNSLVICENDNPNPDPTPRPSSGKGKSLLDIPNSPSTPIYSCPLCEKEVRGASALWGHYSHFHMKKTRGFSGASSSCKASGIEGDSDEEA